MKFYPHHVNDYRSATSYLSNEEDICYRRMLDMYYDTEQPFENDPRLLSRLTKVSHAVVEDILKEFFILIDGKWHNSRADKEILDWYRRSDSAREKADKRWKMKRENAALIQNTCSSNAVALPEVCCDDAATMLPNTHNPIPISKPKVKSVGASATRLPADWKPSEEEIDYCKTQRPDLILEKVVENFSDYWHAKGGAAARKVDWSATWRSWVRNEKSQTNGRSYLKEKQDSDSITNKALGLDKLAAAIKARQAFSGMLLEGETL